MKAPSRRGLVAACAAVALMVAVTLWNTGTYSAGQTLAALRQAPGPLGQGRRAHDGALAQAVGYGVQGGSQAGGGTSGSASYVLQGSAGQVSDSSSSEGYTATGGLWSPTSPGTAIYMPFVARGVEIGPADAPDSCPGRFVQVGRDYEEAFDHENDNDWWAFQAQAGVSYTIRTFDLASRSDTVLHLYDTDCSTELAENDDAPGGGPRSSITWQAPAAGEYHAMVRHYDWRVTGPETSYTLSIVPHVEE